MLTNLKSDHTMSISPPTINNTYYLGQGQG